MSDVEPGMTNAARFCRPRDSVTAAFAAALDGDAHAECELRELAVHHDGAADALCALAYSEDPRPVRPADVAATDQTIAAVLEAIAGTATKHEGELKGEFRALLKAGRPWGLRP